MGPIKTECRGLKCDAAGCGWEDMSIPRSEYRTWRNAPCPHCGANVLTDADYCALRRVEWTIRLVNLLFFWMRPPHPAEEAHVTRVRFGSEGTGRVTVEKLS